MSERHLIENSTDARTTIQLRVASKPVRSARARTRRTVAMFSIDTARDVTTLSSDHCRITGGSSERTWIEIASDRNWMAAGMIPPGLPRSCHHRMGATSRLSLLKSSDGQNSIAMPVNEAANVACLTKRRPTAGSWITTPFRPTLVRTTKWLKFQCRTAGRDRSWRSSRSILTARVRIPMLCDSSDRSRKLPPRLVMVTRRRRPCRSLGLPRNVAIMARHATQHSAFCR